MPLIKPKERIIAIGNEEVCGIVEMRAQTYITADERQYITNAIADRPTNDQLTADLVEHVRMRGQIKRGDLLDYLSDSTKLSPNIKATIESSEVYQTLIQSKTYEQYIGECNANALAELKAFVELRITDPAIGVEVENMSVKQFGTQGEFCPNFKLFDYLYTFYNCEQRGVYYRESMVDERTQSSFLLLHFPDAPSPTPETDSASLTLSSTSAASDTEDEWDLTQNPESQTSSEPQPSENSSSTINEPHQ